jgi:hypothetical protein
LKAEAEALRRGAHALRAALGQELDKVRKNRG